MINFMLIDNRLSIGQVSFAKRDDLFHIRAIPNGLMKCICVCVRACVFKFEGVP
jgi:hypothetical protein